MWLKGCIRTYHTEGGEGGKERRREGGKETEENWSTLWLKGCIPLRTYHTEGGEGGGKEGRREGGKETEETPVDVILGTFSQCWTMHSTLPGRQQTTSASQVGSDRGR